MATTTATEAYMDEAAAIAAAAAAAVLPAAVVVPAAAGAPDEVTQTVSCQKGCGGLAQERRTTAQCSCSRSHTWHTLFPAHEP